MSREALEAVKTAEAVALEIPNAEVRWLASTLAAKASYASMEDKLAYSIVEEILQQNGLPPSRDAPVSAFEE